MAGLNLKENSVTILSGDKHQHGPHAILYLFVTGSPYIAQASFEFSLPLPSNLFWFPFLTGSHHVAQASFEFLPPLLPMLGLQACTSMPSLPLR